MRKILPLLLALAAVIALPAYATPTPISTTINLGLVFAGNTPDGNPPWLTATFTSDVGSTTGTLTLTSNLSASDFLQGLNSSKSTVGWAFFLNQSVSSITCTSTNCAAASLFSSSGFNSGPVKPKHSFNLAFGWVNGDAFPSSPNAFVAGSSNTYMLTFANELTGNPFVANTDGWSSVAHVQGITGGCSGWIVNGSATPGAPNGTPCTSTPPPHTVPEPAELGMFGLGVLLVGLFVGLRRRYR